MRKILETKKGLEDKISKEAYNAAIISVFDEKEQARSQQEVLYFALLISLSSLFVKFSIFVEFNLILCFRSCSAYYR